MVQLTQIFIVYICVTFAKCHLLFGTGNRRVHHDISEIPQMISHLINQHLGHGYPFPYNNGLNRPGLQGSNMNFGPSTFGFGNNRPSNIYGGLYGALGYPTQQGPSSNVLGGDEESGEDDSQNPNSGEDIPSIQIPEMPTISDGGGDNGGVNLQDNSNGNSGADMSNGQNVDLTGQGIADNTNVNVPNIQIPQAKEISAGVDKNPVSGASGIALGVDTNNPTAAIHTAGPVVGQLGPTGLPNSIGVNENIDGNKHDIAIDTTGQDKAKINLNASSDPIKDLHVNVPVAINKQTPDVKVVIDSDLQNTIKDIFKPDDQDVLAIGIDEPKVIVSGNSSQNISSSVVKVPDVSISKDENLKQKEIPVAGSSITDNSALIMKEDGDQDSKLKTNQPVDNSDIPISKHKDKTSIVFPDQLNEAKDKIQKKKNESQLSKLNDINGLNNGQILYAVNIGSSITPSNQGFYVSPTSTDNGQQVYVNSPSSATVQYVPQSPDNTVSNTISSGTTVQYVPQNPSNTVSNPVSSGTTVQYVPQNPSNTVSNTISGGTTVQYVPQNPSNTMSDAVSSGTPVQYVSQNPSNSVSNTVPSGATVQYIPQSPSNTVTNTVPSGSIVSTNGNGDSTNGGYTMVNVPTNGNSNSGQTLYNYPTSSTDHSNGYYQVPNNPAQQAYYTVQLSNGQIALVPVSSSQCVQSNGQIIVPSNGQQYVVINGQPVQSAGQIVSLNGQQYVTANGQPIQGNNQVMMTSNGQQYVPSSNQPMQGNGQIITASNGQQYAQINVQPPQNNGQVVVQGNGQQYVQSNGQPANGQYVVASNGQNYVPSGQVSIPWSQGTVQNNGQAYVPLNNQNPQSNIISVPAGSVVTVGGSTPLMMFKDKDESASKPSSSGKDKDDKIDEKKDEIKVETKDKTEKPKLKLNKK